MSNRSPELQPLRVGDGISRGTDAFKNSIGVQIGVAATSAGFLILAAAPAAAGPEWETVTNLIWYLWLQPVLGAGVSLVALHQLDRDNTQYSLMFQPFRRSLGAIGLGTLSLLATFGPIAAIGMAAGIAAVGFEDGGGGGIALLIAAIGFGMLMAVLVQLLLFWVYPAFAEGYGPLESIRLSSKLASRNIFGTLGLWLLFILLQLGGALFCGVGLIVTIPLGMSMTAAAYRTAVRAETTSVEQVFE